MKRKEMAAYLTGGDRRSIGRANQVVKLAENQPSLLPQLIREMWNPDPIVAMRAADAVEKLTRRRERALQPFKKELLGLAEETDQQELRWHLAAMLPRLQLSPAECRRVTQTFFAWLDDKSSIVKTFALQGLFDLSLQHSELCGRVEELLTAAVQTGTAAMKVRSRKLLSRMAKKCQGNSE